MKICSKCKHVSIGEKYCANCGQSVEDLPEIICLNGHKIAPWEKFCKQCGAEIPKMDHIV